MVVAVRIKFARSAAGLISIVKLFQVKGNSLLCCRFLTLDSQQRHFLNSVLARIKKKQKTGSIICANRLDPFSASGVNPFRFGPNLYIK